MTASQTSLTRLHFSGHQRQRRPAWQSKHAINGPINVLLIGPYDPNSGEYTFLAPPLGVWRLAGHIRSLGHRAEVFDPNCTSKAPEAALREKLASDDWHVVGFSTTGMTLRFDLALAHLAANCSPDSLLIAGGMEATFNPDRLFELGPFDLLVLGEGEKPLDVLLDRLERGERLDGIPGTALPLNNGSVQRFHGPAMNAEELTTAISRTPYAEMPYQAYWERLESAYDVQGLPYKAAREARLAEIRSVRLITLNYCPMGCTFCSSTNFLHSAQGSVAKIARLSADDCLSMIERIVAEQPQVKTIIFQDDIFVFTKDQRILELCEKICAAKANGGLPANLQFISTNRIDAMTPERLAAMRDAGFRVLGFGIENFSPHVLKQFNKGQIHRHIEPALNTALELGITPFLDLILTSPRSRLDDLIVNIREAARWMERGCEVGIYPYVIPFSGAAMSNDESLFRHTRYEEHTIAGTTTRWRQANQIAPVDPLLRDCMRRICERFDEAIAEVEGQGAHLPSRVRSLFWIAAGTAELVELGFDMPPLAPHLQAAPLHLRAALARTAAVHTIAAEVVA